MVSISFVFGTVERLEIVRSHVSIGWIMFIYLAGGSWRSFKFQPWLVMDISSCFVQ